MESLTTNVTAAAVISFLISFLKKQQWFPWLTSETERANRIAAVVLSGLASLGIHAQFNHGTLVITGLTLTTIAVAAWHWLTQFAITHGWFKATSASDQLLALLKAYMQNMPAVSNGPAPAAGPLPPAATSKP